MLPKAWGKSLSRDLTATDTCKACITPSTKTTYLYNSPPFSTVGKCLILFKLQNLLKSVHCLFDNWKDAMSTNEILFQCNFFDKGVTYHV